MKGSTVEVPMFSVQALSCIWRQHLLRCIWKSVNLHERDQLSHNLSYSQEDMQNCCVSYTLTILSEIVRATQSNANLLKFLQRHNMVLAVPELLNHNLGFRDLTVRWNSNLDIWRFGGAENHSSGIIGTLNLVPYWAGMEQLDVAFQYLGQYARVSSAPSF